MLMLSVFIVHKYILHDGDGNGLVSCLVQRLLSFDVHYATSGEHYKGHYKCHLEVLSRIHELGGCTDPFLALLYRLLSSALFN